MTATAIDEIRVAELEQAFALFNATSRDLQAAWATLEARAAQLTRERDEADQARWALAERMQALLETLPGAVIVLDAQGVIHECNAGAHELLGSPLIQQRWVDIIAREFRSESDADGTPCLANGRRLSVSRRATPDGGSVLLLTDDSEAHARRTGVERQRRLSAIDDMNARLAHQLRTPLASAVLYLSRIAGGGLDAPTSQRLAIKALAPLHELQRLIDGMLALARGTLDEAETISLPGLLQEVRQHAAARLANGAELHIACASSEAEVRGQRHLLRSALLNLVDNGLSVANRVSIDVHGDDRCWHIAVEDNGPGIDDDITDRIFDPFFTTRHDGTGLGLATARAIADAHGGRLAHEPCDHGARFVLSLPHALSGQLLPSASSMRAHDSGHGDTRR